MQCTKARAGGAFHAPYESMGKAVRPGEFAQSVPLKDRVRHQRLDFRHPAQWRLRNGLVFFDATQLAT
jgi:hypothetical protein